MNVKSCSRLPSLIRAAREASGTSQRDLAVNLGVDQTQLSAWETGRRGVQDRGTLKRIADALKLSTAGLEELEWARNHDRVISTVHRVEMPEAVRLVSLALQASYVLNQEEAQGLEALVSELIQGKRQLSELAAHRSKELL